MRRVGRPFVIDAYTRRTIDRMGLMAPEWRGGYDDYQQLFHRNLPKDAALFNEYHALLDQHGKTVCVKAPRCSGCCLRDICATGMGSGGVRRLLIREQRTKLRRFPIVLHRRCEAEAVPGSPEDRVGAAFGYNAIDVSGIGIVWMVSITLAISQEDKGRAAIIWQQYRHCRNPGCKVPKTAEP